MYKGGRYMDYNLLTLAELKNLAKEANIKGVSGLKKDELILVLTENDREKEGEAKASPAKSGAKKTAAAKGAAEKTEKAAEEKTAKAPAKKAEEESAKAPAEKAAEEKTAKAPAKKAVEEKTAKDSAKKAAEEESAKKPAETEKAEEKPVKEKAPEEEKKEEAVPVRRPIQGVRPVGTSEQRPMPVGRQADQRQGVRPMQPVSRPGVQGVRPVSGGPRPAAGDARATQPQQRPTSGVQNNVQRPAQDRPVSYPRNSREYERELAETLMDYIDANYRLAGTPTDSGETKEGILEVMPEGFGFIRCDNFLPGSEDVYVSPMQVKRLGLKTGDYIVGNTKERMPNEKFSALLYINTVNKLSLYDIVKRKKFEDLTPVFPNQRFHLETPGCGPAMRMVDLLSPIGKGQRGMIVSQPKAGKTTLLKQIAKALIRNHPSIHLIILLIDERPEEVTDMKESINGENVEVIYSTFDEQPENHKRVSEMVIERARRLVEQKEDVVILLDSITRLARAYNLTVTASGRTLSGGLDPSALYMPKKFFGAARNMREGGSLTVLATALVETGSRMDDVVFEEFKGTGNMELVLDRNLSERRVFPAIDLPKSGTRREDLLLTPQELEASNIIRRAFNSAKTDEVVERIINLFTHTRNNAEFVEMVKKTRIVP